jgi:acetyltransferase-like isoleucine patch superfamily enzyme
LSGFLLKVRRAETPFYARLKAIGKAFLRVQLPVPKPLHPLMWLLYRLHFGVFMTYRTLMGGLYCTPLFRGRCEVSGKGVWVPILPHVMGHTRIYLGDYVVTHGKLAIISGRVCDEPTLIIGDRVSIGHEVGFSVNREIVIEDDVMIASNCQISDNDGHPRNAAARLDGQPPQVDEVKPVRICSGAWIGEGCSIRKGVTIGQGAIVSTGSVVWNDVAPYAIVVGNPARVVGFAGQAQAAKAE